MTILDIKNNFLRRTALIIILISLPFIVIGFFFFEVGKGALLAAQDFFEDWKYICWDYIKRAAPNVWKGKNEKS